MPVKIIHSRNPTRESTLWMTKYTYQQNISKILSSTKGSPPTGDECDYIVSCFKQGLSYFKSAESADIEIKPLLIYYGLVNLLIGTVSIIDNQPKIKHHGLMINKIPEIPLTSIAETTAKPINPSFGGLFLLSKPLCDVDNFDCSTEWSLIDILNGIPELKNRITEYYPTRATRILLLESGNFRDLEFSRIHNDEFVGWENKTQAINLIQNFDSNYLPPQQTTKYVVLHSQHNKKCEPQFDIDGNSYFHLGILKNSKIFHINQLIQYYIGFFILSSISRYNPNVWNKFISSDPTGERLIIETLCDISTEIIPMLIISKIENTEIRFVTNPPEKLSDAKLYNKIAETNKQLEKE